jgi:hypothetical protein
MNIETFLFPTPHGSCSCKRLRDFLHTKKYIAVVY